MAAVKGERDIAVGNVIGSNVFNLLGIILLAIYIAYTAWLVVRGCMTASA